MKKIVVFTGAGVSADSGLSTFRDADGLWANDRIEDVCTPEALARNRSLVIEFYNKRRKELLSTEPNAAHYAIAELERYFDVEVVTQNVDDLHERAGSTNVIHLHGELMKGCSSRNPNDLRCVREFPSAHTEISIGDKADDGSQLRPYIVWFGEAVPLMDDAIRSLRDADMFIVIGTSLNVYPAAGLLNYSPLEAPVFVIDPNEVNVHGVRNVTAIRKGASEGMQEIIEKYL